jgi:hypothetical protein
MSRYLLNDNTHLSSKSYPYFVIIYYEYGQTANEYILHGIEGGTRYV